jgi:putative transposase
VEGDWISERWIKVLRIRRLTTELALEPAWQLLGQSGCWVVLQQFEAGADQTSNACFHASRQEAQSDLFDCIEGFYDRVRRHSHLGGISPEAFERASI